MYSRNQCYTATTTQVISGPHSPAPVPVANRFGRKATGAGPFYTVRALCRQLTDTP